MMSRRTSLSSLSFALLVLLVLGTQAALPLSGCGDATSAADARDGARDAPGDGGASDHTLDLPRGDGARDDSAGGPLTIGDPGPQSVDEERALTLAIEVSGGAPPVRVQVLGLPPGARFDETRRELTFRPDFIQGGKTHELTIVARDAAGKVERKVTLTVNDTIKPPAPSIVSETDHGDHRRMLLKQGTDSWLDSPGYAGRSFDARISVPKGASATDRRPVRVDLHGFSGWPPDAGHGREFRIYPHDSMDTYWWGYSDQLPGGTPTKGTVPPYTARRVLALVEWVLKTYPGADPDRVYIGGGSMGGAGAKTIGLLWARHFCYIDAIIGQAIPRNHRPLRIAQLSTLWGTPQDNLPDDQGMGVWDRMDLTRVLRDSPEARDQHIYTKHGRDDVLIHFGAVVMPSPLTKVSYYQALQTYHPGHFAVWDEGGHGPPDPVIGDIWWEWGWNRLEDPQTFLKRGVLHAAFSHCSADQDPGDGSPNGKQPWRDNEGYAGELAVGGDTGWNGEIAGVFNRFLRWDASKAVDTWERLELPLEVLDGNGADAPKAGYPTKGNRFDKTLPVRADVTLRRVQRFTLLPGEQVSYTFGATTGTAKAGPDGALTIEKLPLTTSWQTLIVTR
ncbi:MAG: hypothetical protein KC503_43390 [Myxococcales bacterium]|nr:hypothetical protein [Myxococcales bacterium]